MQAFNVRIKKIGALAAATGVFLCDGGDKLHRKLEVGEIIRVVEGGPGFDAAVHLLEDPQSPIELTHEPPTRPVRFKDRNTAKWSSPSLKAAKTDQLSAMQKARIEMAKQRDAELDEFEKTQRAQEPEAGNAEAVLASDAVRAFAADQGVDLRGVTGTGKGGRVTMKDVKAAAALVA